MSKQPGRGLESRKLVGELFTLTYGALVSQLIKDYDNDDEINKQLDKMGYNIGIRLVEDFMARSNVDKCQDFRETAEVLSKMAFKMYLNISPTIANWSPANDEFSFILDNNPLVEFVELPDDHPDLNYSNILCGAIRGALEMLQLEVETWFSKDVLKGDNITELRVKYIKRLTDALPAGED
ncbi:trafficking protein particle complex subunit 3-like [Clavelina lepadiformis]|uniref:Trafficking protein particle complex subunit n=1 Tax=Clavelina lepadiformis TaxID=159417 RepID=A0ABP0GSM2_CLALP